MANNMTTYNHKQDNDKDFARKQIIEYFNESYVADDVTLGPFCSNWVKELSEERESKLEKELRRSK